MARGSTREIKKQKDREIFRVYGQRAWYKEAFESFQSSPLEKIVRKSGTFTTSI